MFKRYITALLALLISFSTYAINEDDLLDPSDAFAFTIEAESPNTLNVEWDIADGYYLYKNKVKFESLTPGVEIGTVDLPPGKIKQDEFFGEIEIWRGERRGTLTLDAIPEGVSEVEIKVSSQGCADIGICYPPQKDRYTVKLPTKDSSSFSLSSLTSNLSSSLGFGGEEEELLTAEAAFPFTIRAKDAHTLIARWDIVPGYYLYKDKFEVISSDETIATIGNIKLPKGKEKNDEFFGLIEVYLEPVEFPIYLQRTILEKTELPLTIKFQGCAEIGICYPPQKLPVTVKLPAAPSASPEITETSALPAPTATPSSPPQSEQDSLAEMIKTSSTFTTILVFLGLGLLLAFTPCVFPMIPILSSIIAGQGANISTRKSFILSLTYVLAMAFTYTTVGIIAGLFGANLQATFQNPWILGSFSLIFVLLSLSMFGFYELQLPSSLQSKLASISNSQKGGTLTGVAIMGILSALIVGPCVAPPLMGALIYIGQTGDAVLGGIALFAMSMGMGAPLLLIGISAGKFLPKAGGWMDAVKAVFGVMMLAVAIWMLERILPASITMLLWATILIVSAIYMGATDTISAGISGWKRLWKGVGIILLAWGMMILIGTAADNNDPLSPLKGVSGGGYASTQSQAKIDFQKLKGLDLLNQAIANANRAGKTVMVDFTADWCISCKEFEKYTFSDQGVISALSGTVAIKADVTDNDELDKELMKKYGIIGPPAILFIGTDGIERKNYRVVGFMDAPEFQAHVKAALGN